MARSIPSSNHILAMAILFCTTCSFFLCVGGSTRRILLLEDKLQRLHTALSARQRDLMAFQTKPFSPRAYRHVPVTDDKMDDIGGEILGKRSSVSSVDEAAAILESMIDVPNGPNPLHNEESPIHKLTP